MQVANGVWCNIMPAGVVCRNGTLMHTVSHLNDNSYSWRAWDVGQSEGRGRGWMVGCLAGWKRERGDRRMWVGKREMGVRKGVEGVREREIEERRERDGDEENEGRMGDVEKGKKRGRRMKRGDTRMG